nr:hypothetical protein [Tanacetum cinerariifolium]
MLQTCGRVDSGPLLINSSCGNKELCHGPLHWLGRVTSESICGVQKKEGYMAFSNKRLEHLTSTGKRIDTEQEISSRNLHDNTASDMFILWLCAGPSLSVCKALKKINNFWDGPGFVV